MKIACVSPYFFPAHVYGGPINSVHQLCLHLNRLGHTVRVLTTNANGTHSVLPGGSVTHLAPGYAVHYYRRVGQHSLAPGLLLGLQSAVRWADIVYLTPVYSFPTVPALLLSRLVDTPVVWSPRGSLQRWDGSTRPRAKAIWERICFAARPPRLRLHFTSPEEAAASAARLPRVAQAVIPNGVAIPNLAPRAAWDGMLRLLYLGRLNPIKGIELLLSACTRLRYCLPCEWTLTIAGSGPKAYEAELRALVVANSIEGRVSFVGDANAVKKQNLFAEADFLVLPSYVENFGMVVAEALAHRVPVVVSKGVPWRRVEEVGCGLWVSNDPETLARAIVDMAELPLREMGERGRSWMERDFAWPIVARRVAREFETLVQASH